MCPTDYPALVAHHERIAAMPKIAAYLVRGPRGTLIECNGDLRRNWCPWGMSLPACAGQPEAPVGDQQQRPRVISRLDSRGGVIMLVDRLLGPAARACEHTTVAPPGAVMAPWHDLLLARSSRGRCCTAAAERA